MARVLPGARGDPGGLVEGHAKGQHRAQNAAAIHGIGRQQVEQKQQQIAQGDALGQVGIGWLDQFLERHKASPGSHPGGQSGGDEEIHQRPRQRDGQFLARIRLAFRPRDPADGVHHDFQRANTVVLRHQRVTELVQQHRGEQRQNIERRHRARLVPADSNE